jgi:hypothetical protein
MRFGPVSNRVPQELLHHSKRTCGRRDPSTSYPEAKDNSRIFQPDTFQNNGHVTVWVPFIPVWDVWYYDERSHKGEEYASPWTLALLFGVPNEEVPVP